MLSRNYNINIGAYPELYEVGFSLVFGECGRGSSA